MLSLLIGLVVIAVLLVVNGCVFVVKSIEIKYETPTNLSEEEQQEFDRNIIEKSADTACFITVIFKTKFAKLSRTELLKQDIFFH